MTQTQLRWFLSSEAFLRNLENLWSVGVIPYCAICAYAHQKDDVSAVWHSEGQKFVVRSICRAGEIALAKVQALSLAELLANLGWRLRCGNRCASLNMADGIAGNNDQNGSRLAVTCGCTERVHVAPEVGHA